MKRKDLMGLKFGRWTVLRRDRLSYWICRCACGKEKSISSQSLRGSTSTSCGCSRRHLTAKGCGTDWTGHQTETFAVLKLASRGSHQGRRWECQCFCGQRFTAEGSRIKDGKSLSCGCLTPLRISASRRARSSRSGLSTHPLYGTWWQMMSRCYDPRDLGYRNYGGRGIAVCARWHDLSNFIVDMGPRPSGMSIDRIDNNGNYEPGNCRWATKAQQSRNRRDTCQLTMADVTLPLIEWCEIYGQSLKVAKHRIYNSGWDPWEALNVPPLRAGRRASAVGNTSVLAEMPEVI